jgi:hypothetical protein
MQKWLLVLNSMKHPANMSSLCYTRLHLHPPQLGTIDGSWSETLIWSVPVSKLSQRPGVWIICNKNIRHMNAHHIPCTCMEMAKGDYLITLIMEVASTSETSVNFYQTTQCNIPLDGHLHSCCHENLKSHLEKCYVSFTQMWHLQQYNLCRIWGSHSGEYEDGCLLGCSTV